MSAEVLRTWLNEREVYGNGHHLWNSMLRALTEQYGFVPKVCRSYRAKIKGKVEHFNRYLKESSVVPLATAFKPSGLMLIPPTRV